MKALIITVAGESKRFRQTIGFEALKCIYTPSDYSKTILAYQISISDAFDKIIIVGGYKFHELKEFIYSNYKDDRIELVYNDKYNTFGSAYSLLIGIKHLKHRKFSEIIFCEGDLYFDKQTFQSIVNIKNNVVTTNLELIEAKRSVAFYSRINNSLKYIYDTKHSVLEIKEPFTGIFNSGQVWKFVDQKKLNSVINELNPTQIKGTNLEIIQNYFLIDTKYAIIRFNDWINCNTIMDYKIFKTKLF
jgi:choline kinase